MTDEIMMRMDEDGTLAPWEVYATVECETKEDYDSLIEMVELGRSIVRCKDCKWYHLASLSCDFWDESYRDPEHFCAEGVRREEHV